MSARDLLRHRLFWPVCFAAATATASSGCEVVLIIAATADDDDGDYCYDACECYGDCWTDDDGTEPPAPTPPTLTINIADWPPIGPTGEVEVQASTTSGTLSTATFYFRNQFVTGFGATTSGTVSVNGNDLGEGLGTLAVEVRTSQGAGARQEVTDLLVDLTAPTAYADDTILPASGADLSFWIADAWVVSGYELQVAGKVFSETLEPGYPSTLGVEWDYSLVTIPVSEIPTGVHQGILRVFDAAGNEAILDLPLTIDGIPPTASVDSPAEGAVLSGPFAIDVSGQDDLPGGVSLELRVGGALVATALGPTASVVVDAAEFAEGPIDIAVIAVDEAGNQSAPSVHTVTISHP